MSFTWNGLTVNDVFPIEAMYTLSESTYVNSTASVINSLEQDIKNRLAQTIADRVMQSTEIHKERDPSSATTTYYAKAYMVDVKKHPMISPSTPLPNSGVITASQWNGTSFGGGTSISRKDSEFEKFRVCEYTKNGKVTRVELQYNNDGFWEKIPRIKIEE